MKMKTQLFVALASGLLAAGPALADSYSDTVERVKNAGNAGEYYRGVATLITGEGGLMYDIAATGQEFTFTPVR